MVTITVSAALLMKRATGWGLSRSTPTVHKNKRAILGWAPHHHHHHQTTNKVLYATSSSSSSSSTTDPALSTATKGGRLSRHIVGGGGGDDASIDVRTIANHLDVVLSHLAARRAGGETMAAARQIQQAASKRVELIRQRDAALNQRKEQSALVGKFMRDQKNDDDANDPELLAAKAASARATAAAEVAEQELTVLQQQMDTLLAGIPNLLDDRVPDGDNDSQNQLVYEWGDKKTLPAIAKQTWNDDFTPLWHDDVATQLGGYRQDAAVQMSGTRFIALSGSIARLERALGMFFMDLHTDQHGYTEVTVPYVVSRSALEGTSQLPKFEQDLFAITPQSHTCNGQDAFLIPTAEVPVTNLHRDSVLDEADLPLSYVAWTPCFRAEAGSYGRDTKGLVRTHQFHKVELVKITTAETSDAEHEALTGHAEACLQALELPYRKMRLSSGDIGFAARHCYDLEVWLPGANEYREISSCSNTGDFQARRMALRYRPKASTAAKKPKPVLCHTINGSGLAVGRTLVAVLENYQQPDGTVIVPKVLRPYMGGKEVLSLASE
jgi:seryl-tRNA synthetase